MRRIAIPAALALGAALALVATSPPADAAITASAITSPADGAHYVIDATHPASIVTVEGTTNGELGDLIELRCYESPHQYTTIHLAVDVLEGGGFRALLGTSSIQGTCVLKAVPAGLPDSASVTSYTGPRLTVERNTPVKLGGTGPNKDKVISYDIAYQGSKAFNDYAAAMDGGLARSRLTYPSGFSSQYLWFGNAFLRQDATGGVAVRVDARRAYGPASALSVNENSPGYPQLSFNTSRDPATGVTTIHETDPFVHCFDDGCDRFVSAGVRLERTIVTDDGGRQVHITDVWRSIDRRTHTLALQYANTVEARDIIVGLVTDVGLRLPWLQPGYRTFTSDSVLPGTTKRPVTISVRDKNDAADGDTTFPRGAITVDTPPHQLHWPRIERFFLRDEGLVVPAGGTRVVRHDYVIGTSEAEIAAKAAASRTRINPYRPDTLVKARAAYAGNGIYNTTGTAQTAILRKKRGKTARYSILVQNDGTITDSYRLKGAGKKKGFTVTYLAGRKDVTRQVIRGTYTLTNLAPGAQRTLKLVIKVKPTAKKNKLRAWPVTSTSTHDTTSRDTIAAAVKVKR